MSIIRKYDPAYAKEWKLENVDRIPFEVPKGKKEMVKRAASKRNVSVNRLITEALEIQYNINLARY